MPQILLATESSQSRSLPLDAQLLLNFFTERQPQSAKSQAPLFGAPGLALFSTTPLGPSRGGWNFNGVYYEVGGDTLYRIDQYGNATDVSGGLPIGGSNPVGMSDNGIQLCIVNGVEGFIYTTAGGLVQITDTAFYPSKTVTFMDGYFLFERLGTNEWFISALYDGLAYNGLDFATAEGAPGTMTATAQNLELVFLFSSSHIEIWYDAGTNNFPFQRYSGGVIPYGCVSPYSVTKQDGALFFLGTDKIMYRLQANVPVRISTHPIEHIIAQDPDLTTAEVFTYTLEGHKFIVLTLVNINRTLVFDISTQKWHDRDSCDADYVSLGRWRGRNATNVYEQTIIGDAIDGRVGKVDWTAYTEYGNTMRGQVYSAPQHADRKRVFCSRFELDVQAGVGLANAPGDDPQIMLDYSRDGAMTWSLQQKWRSMGRIGQFLKRLRWLRMGQARQWVWRLTVTDPVPRVIIAAHADLQAGV